MPIKIPSMATEADISAYTSGYSHALAVALHRRFGWKMLVVTDARDPYWVDPEVAENSIPVVVHVYALDGNGDAWDIRGKRTQADVKDDCYEFFNVQDFETEVCADEDDLAFYVGTWSDAGDPIERPLPYYSEGDIVEAEAILVKAFPNMPIALIETDECQRRFPR